MPEDIPKLKTFQEDIPKPVKIPHLEDIPKPEDIPFFCCFFRRTYLVHLKLKTDFRDGKKCLSGHPIDFGGQTEDRPYQKKHKKTPLFTTEHNNTLKARKPSNSNGLRLFKTSLKCTLLTGKMVTHNPEVVGSSPSPATSQK